MYQDSRCWRVHLCFDQTSPAADASSKEMSSTRLHRRRRRQPLLRQQPGRMVPAPPTSLPRLRPVRVLKLAPAILRPVRAPCRASRLLSLAAAAVENIASMSLSKSGLAEAPRRPRREAPETAEARRGARPLFNRQGNHCYYSG